MDQCTREVRMAYWKEIIERCQARPENQTAKQWLRENNIREQTYYAWQRKIRQQTYEQMQTLSEPEQQNEITFAEITMPVAAVTENTDAVSGKKVIQPVAVIKTAGCSIAIAADIPEHILTRLLEVVTHA